MDSLFRNQSDFKNYLNELKIQCEFNRLPVNKINNGYPMGKNGRTVVYRIDCQDNIIYVNNAWSAFARENDGEKLEKESVLNRPVWKYIYGKETKHIYEILFNKVRTGQKGINFPFRCDSPTMRRFMELKLLPLPNNGIELEACTLKEESRRQLNLLDAFIKKSHGHLMMCSWCKKVNVNDQWIEIEDALIQLDLFGEKELPGLTHGICLCCKEILEETIAEELASQKSGE